jgi:hypothetical protein
MLPIKASASLCDVCGMEQVDMLLLAWLEAQDLKIK